MGQSLVRLLALGYSPGYKIKTIVLKKKGKRGRGMEGLLEHRKTVNPGAGVGTAHFGRSPGPAAPPAEATVAGAPLEAAEARPATLCSFPGISAPPRLLAEAPLFLGKAASVKNAVGRRAASADNGLDMVRIRKNLSLPLPSKSPLPVATKPGTEGPVRSESSLMRHGAGVGSRGHTCRWAHPRGCWRVCMRMYATGCVHQGAIPPGFQGQGWAGGES